MTAPRILIGIAELEVAKAPCTLTALALGSCVAVILHDPESRVGGLAHVLLPTPNVGRPRPDSPGRFASTAVKALLEGMLGLGAEPPRLTARLVGGASMFSALQPPGSIQMGERNVHAARDALHRAGITLVGEAVGGDFGRSVSFDIGTGRVLVTGYEREQFDL